MANYLTTCVTMFAKSIDMISEDMYNDELIIDVSVWTGFLTANCVGEEEIPSLIHWESQSKSRFRKPLQKLFSENQPDTFLSEIIQRIGIPFTLENIHWGCDGFPADPTYETLEEIITHRLSKIAIDCAAGRKSPRMQFFIRKANKEEIICCSVCIKGLKKGTQAIRLPCLHIFHGFCIFRWLSENPTCPICRFELFSL
ncbi:hypothetical protein MIMGU_mgv1a025012mg, partial [Erythranthe guttata]